MAYSQKNMGNAFHFPNTICKSDIYQGSFNYNSVDFISPKVFEKYSHKLFNNGFLISWSMLCLCLSCLLVV